MRYIMAKRGKSTSYQEKKAIRQFPERVIHTVEKTICFINKWSFL